MEKTAFTTALFDFDGTLVDTEPQYSLFWGAQGKRYHSEIPGFERVIKGQTLGQIFDGYFAEMEEVQRRICDELALFEEQMQFEYIPGAREYVLALREKGVKTAIVTSSNDRKMSHVFQALPELSGMFDLILTADMFLRSKPDPDCFLTAATRLGCNPDECVVFEDSLHGLEAARRAGMKVVALATTNPVERIASLADEVWDDFVGK